MIFSITGLHDKLPIINEGVRRGDIIQVGEVKNLKMTVKQLVAYLLLLDSEGITFESITEPCFNSNTKEGKQLIDSLKVIQQANKYYLSSNSSDIEGSGRSEGSHSKDTELAVIAMYKVTQNVAAISRALNIKSRDTVYRHLKRNNLF